MSPSGHDAAAENGGGGAVDVVVVGAGLAGLCAARKLAQQGVAVVVLEARDRVGGRTLSRSLGRDTIDLGGQWIGPAQQRIARLARELGVHTSPQYCRGKKVLALNGRVSTYRGTIPSLSLLSLLDLQRTIFTLEKLRRQVPLRRPSAAPSAAEWDRWTVEGWKRRHVPTRGAQAVVDSAVRAVFAAEPGEVSFLHFLFILNSGGGLMRLVNVTGGAQQDRFIGGAQQISGRIADQLGHRVVLDAPVRAIEQDDSGVTVHGTVQGAALSYRARYAIVAIPPVLAGGIDYHPALPTRRDELTRHMPMGSAIKGVAAYETPFWRRAGFSGEVVSDGGAVGLAFDDSPSDDAQGALVVFVLGAAARSWSQRPPDERRRAVLDDLVRFFGSQAGSPLAYAEQDWTAEPWSCGCYFGLMPPGTLTAYGEALRQPVGRIFWAGTETALEWCGYMDGAVGSGERAAGEIIARLGRSARDAVPAAVRRG